MSYSNFTFKKLKTEFGISNQVIQLFNDIKPIKISEKLTEDLAIATTLPVRSEKAKSELIVMPILLDLMKRNEQFFTIYSGDTLNADKDAGLTGECDFILGKNTGMFDINTPIITILEAKKNDIELGIPQCAAQILGARIYNKEYDNEIKTIYGCVTNADTWVFLKLEKDTIYIDKQKYYLSEIERLMGVLQEIINQYKLLND